ncbi:MAG: LamG domain-containing protein, partial [Thermoplasmata archaeon]|nr:LamG domain-containing protein [Thermoplasmata archaeon]
PIPGTPLFTDDGEFDISFIDPVKYPSIKLNASFIGNNWGLTPTLYYWGVSWNETNTWRDTFFGGLKIENKNDIDAIDGSAQSARLKGEFDVDANTVALWHFDENTGTTAFDETSNKNDGTLGGNGLGTDLPIWTTGRIESGLKFDGTDDFIEVADSNSLDLTGDITIEAWVKLDSMNTDMIIIEKGQPKTAPRNYQASILSGKFHFVFYNGAYYTHIVDQVIPLKTWTYVAVSFDSTANTIKMYYNGENKLTATETHNLVANSNKLGLGGRVDSSAVFTGIIDEVRISNIARTPQEIQDHYSKRGFKKYSILESKPISIPKNHIYDKFVIDKTETQNNYLNVTVLDDQTNNPIPGFEKLSSSSIDLSSINPLINPSIKLEGIFQSDGKSSTVLYDWSVNWTINTPPKIQNIISPNSVNRTHTIEISINITDAEETERNLTLNVEYKAPSDSDWQTTYLSNILYNEDHWECSFAPTAEAEQGLYSFRLTCNDSFQFLNVSHAIDLIEVKNNLPIIKSISTTDT